MTAYTSTQSGDFNDTATWGGGGTPTSNGDTFTVSTGHNVKMNSDLSGLANGLGASTVNGTLYFSRSAGAYVLKMNGILTIGATGTLDASNGSGGAYPSNCTATILLNGNFSVTVNGAVNLICGEPTHKYVRLSQAESSSATTLHVDADLTADSLWASGALIRVDNVNQGRQSEERTISGSPTSTTISITAGLTNAKLQGAVVMLISRNVKILGASSSNGTGISGAQAGTISAEIRSIQLGVSTAAGIVIDGTISDVANAVSAGSGCIVSAMISGATNGVTGNAGGGNIITSVISGCTNGMTGAQVGNILDAAGLITGCTQGVNQGDHMIRGTIRDCTTGLTLIGGMALVGATLTGNAQDVNYASNFTAVNTQFGSAIEFSSYGAASRSPVGYAESVDHDKVAGAFRAWTKGGITSSVASPVYDASRARSYRAVCENASAYAFIQNAVLVPAGGSVYALCYIRKTVSMSYLPRLWVFSAEKEPILAGAPDAERIMTDSTDTWEVLEATVTNTTDAPRLYVVRALAKHASGTVYFDPIIRTSALLIPADMEGLLAS